jgi:hypothetical protein
MNHEIIINIFQYDSIFLPFFIWNKETYTFSKINIYSTLDNTPVAKIGSMTNIFNKLQKKIIKKIHPMQILFVGKMTF